MIHIIIILLKFIGIALLTILGLIVTLLLVILLVPIRYRVWVTHGALFRLESRVSWILHIIDARVTKEGELSRIRIRLFGILLYDSVRPRKQRKSRKSRRKAARSEEQYEEVMVPDSRSRSSRKANTIKRDGHRKDNSVPDILDAGTSVLREEYKREPSTDPGAGLREEVPSTDEPVTEAVRNGKVNIFRRFVNKMKRIIQGIRNKLRGLIEKVKLAWQAFLNIKNKVVLVKEFLSDEENKSAFGVTYGSLKKLLKHVLPRKLKSKVVFGTGDPCSTGQALGAASILYGMYGEHVQITPDFENKVFEGEHYARGRIRIGTLLIIVIKLLLDKKFKQLKRNFKILKEAL